jgi:ribose 5-phosphate isomerase B
VVEGLVIDERTVREMVRRVVLRTVQASADAGLPGDSRLVTQQDIENLTPGSALHVAEESIVTPLARQTALERGVTVVRGKSAETPAADSGSADMRRTVALAADHGGFEMKETLAGHLRERGFSVIDCGTHGTDSVDYPDFALAAARLVAQGQATAAVIVDGAGIGSCMAANKVPGIRAAMCYDEATAVNSREHNAANVLTLGAGLIGGALARRIVDTWLDTPHGGGRHARRVDKIMDIERRYLKG